MARCILCEAQAVDMHFFICPGSEKSARGISKFEIAAAGPSHCEYTLIEERSTSPTDLSLLLLFVTCGQLCDDAAIVCFAGAMVHSPSGCRAGLDACECSGPARGPRAPRGFSQVRHPGTGGPSRCRDIATRKTEKQARRWPVRPQNARLVLALPSPLSAWRLAGAPFSTFIHPNPAPVVFLFWSNLETSDGKRTCDSGNRALPSHCGHYVAYSLES